MSMQIVNSLANFEFVGRKTSLELFGPNDPKTKSVKISDVRKENDAGYDMLTSLHD